MGAMMPPDPELKPPAVPLREIPHAVSPGLWTLAWRRLKTDSIAMVCLAIVAAFLLLMMASGAGLVAKDWAREGGGNYAPPSSLEDSPEPLAAPSGGPAP